jgi:hypothetical protein
MELDLIKRYSVSHAPRKSKTIAIAERSGGIPTQGRDIQRAAGRETRTRSGSAAT